MKKKILLSLVVFCLFQIANAQILRSLLSAEQEMIRKAIDSTLYIVSVDYVLQAGTGDNIRSYGQGNATYFNRFYYFASHVGTSLVVTPNIKSPWLQDPDFESFKNSDTIKPMITSMAVRSVNNGSFAPLEFDIKTSECAVDEPLQLKFSGEGLKNASHLIDSTGWLVLIYLETLPQADSLRYKLSVYKSNPKFEESKSFASIREPADAAKLFGGIYMLPFITRGNIELQVWGMVIKHQEHGWGIMSIDNNNQHENGQNNKLTPIPNP